MLRRVTHIAHPEYKPHYIIDNLLVKNTGQRTINNIIDYYQKSVDNKKTEVL